MHSRVRTLLFGLGCLILGFIVAVLVVAAGGLDLVSFTSSLKQWGRFPTTPKVELLSEGRELRLLEDFVYIDPRDKVWLAPKDFIVDGASIPRVFWSIVGGPLEGKYRNASIVHDEACVRMRESSNDVHLMFYEACRCGGVPEKKAKIMYAAVYHFGPYWELEVKSTTETITTPAGQKRTIPLREREIRNVRFTQEPAVEIREKLERYINEKNPTLDDLKKIDPRTL